MTDHLEIVVVKKSDSPDEDKSVPDSKLLIPTLKDFFSKHPLINPETFLGNAAFDSVELYKKLLTGDTFGNDKHFSKAYILLNARSRLENQDYTINEDGIPTFKFVCPKIKWVYNKTTQKSQGISGHNSWHGRME